MQSTAADMEGFYIVATKRNHLVLGAQDGSNDPGTKVTIQEPSGHGTQNVIQTLWVLCALLSIRKCMCALLVTKLVHCLPVKGRSGGRRLHMHTNSNSAEFQRDESACQFGCIYVIGIHMHFPRSHTSHKDS